VAIFIIAEPIVRVLYERGAFSTEATNATSSALAVFGLGLPAFVMIKGLHARLLRPRGHAHPMLFAGISVAVNVALALTLFPRIAEAGIATAESAAGWVNALLLFGVLRWRGQFAVDAVLAKRLPMLVLSCALMGAALYFGARSMAPLFAPEASLLVQIGALLALIAGGAAVYFLAAEITGAMQLRALVRNFRRKPAGP
jgi:putative peptidoglycan lipid II flippase